jgi:hypothetical protein
MEDNTTIQLRETSHIADAPLAPEWYAYRREADRLLREGHEGQYVLIHGSEVIGIWNTREEALAEGLRRFRRQPILVHRIQGWTP